MAKRPEYLKCIDQKFRGSGTIKGTFDKRRVKKAISKLMLMNVGELKEWLKRPEDERTVLEHWLATVMIKGISRGSREDLEFMLQRVIGRIKDEAISDSDQKPFVIERSDGTKYELGHKDAVSDPEKEE